MKSFSAPATALLASLSIALASLSASAQTLSLNDSAIIQGTTNRIGLNLGSIGNTGNRQILKNLIGSSNPGFEPLQDQQIWVLEQAGTATTFTLPDARSSVPSNYWAGGTFSVIESQSGGTELGCTGAILSNTGPNNPVSTATWTAPVISVPAPCSAPFSVGDMIVLRKSMYPTTESEWESAGPGGFWGSVSGGARLLSDTSDLCATCGTQALNMNAAPLGSSATASWHFDGDNAGHIFTLMNGSYELSFWAKAAGGSPTLVASALRPTVGGFDCGASTPELTSTWAKYTFNCSAAETPATTSGAARVSVQVAGGSVYLDNVSFAKASSSNDNPTVLRDEVIETLQRYFGDSTDAPAGALRYSLGQNTQSLQNWTQPDYAEAPTAAGATYLVGSDSGGSMLSLEDYLVICQFLGVDPYLEVPVTFSTEEAADLIEFLAGPSGTTYGARRVALGQVDPWSEVFDKIHLSFCDRCWNPDFASESLPWQATAPSSQFYYDCSQRARDIFTAMRADSYYSGASFDLVMSAPTAISSSMDTAIQIARPDSIEIDGYQYSTVSRFSPDTALWQSAMVGPYEKVTNPSAPNNFYGSIHDYRSLKACGASGTATCNVNVYGWGQNTVTGGIDQQHLDYVTAGAGSGVVMALQPLLNLQYYGILPQLLSSLAERQAIESNSLAATLRGAAVDMGGATNNVRPAFLGVSLVNQSIIGPMYACPIANNVTYDFAGSTNAAYSLPALRNVPYLYAFCFENGTKRSLILVNTDLAESHTLSFAGSNPPSGSVTQRQYAPAALDDTNEAPAGRDSFGVSTTVSIETSSLSSPSSISLPPHSVTALDYTVPSEPIGSTPMFSPAPGTYSTPQSVAITSTAGASIYYTTDGTTPTTSSSVYNGPITVSGNATLKAIAIAPGFERSPEATAAYNISAALPALDVTPTPSTASAIASVLPAPVSRLAAGTDSTTESMTTSAQTIFNCSTSGTPFNSGTGACSASSSAGAAFHALGGQFSVTGSNQIQLYGSGSPTHGAYAVNYTTTVNVQAFTTTFTYYPSNYTFAFVLQNVNNQSGYEGPIFVAGAGCEGGFFQAKNAGVGGESPNNVFAVIFDQTNDYDNSGNFYYSNTQVFQATQDPCLPNDLDPDWWYTSRISTSPVPLNSPASTQNTTTGDLYSVTLTYDGTNLTENLYDVTAGGSCPGETCFTQEWYNINIPSIVAGNTAYAGLTSSTHGTVTAPLNINSWSYTVDNPPSTPVLATYTADSRSGLGSNYAAAPTFSPAAGAYSGTQNVTISSSTPSSYVCYTVASSTPSVYPYPDNEGGCSTGTLYSGAVTVASTSTIYATAGTSYTGLPSNQVTATYTISGSQASTPSCTPTSGSSSSFITVTCSNSNSGTTIMCYTENGTTPVTNGSGTGCAAGTALSGASGNITISSTTAELNVVAGTGTLSDSTVSSYGAYTIGAVLPTPTFSLGAGTYTSAQTVTISDATAGATIYYTTNGTTPTTSSTVYSGPITVSASETLEAIAVETGDTNSAVATAAYTISLTAATPTLSVPAGTYTSAQTVTISDATAGATIHYTTNGTTPTTSSTVYSGPITVSASETLEAIAVETGDTNSAVATAAYTISLTAATPTFSVPAGTYTSAQTVTISDATAGATIHYTTNGTTPTTSSTVYSGPITVSSSETLEAIAAETGYTNSAVATAAYTISLTAATPTLSVPAGTYTSAQTVTISDATAGATIYYTTNGTTPTTSSTVYSGPITVSASETLEAIAVETGDTNSAVATAAYTISLTAATPTLSVPAGTYTSAQTVTISDATAGATIHYTTNGTTPTTSSTVYSGPITVSSSETLEAIAAETGYTNSAVATAAYTISLTAATPTLSVPAGTYTSAQTVTISDATAGATIYYTTNGTTPTTSSTVYSGPITVSASETLEAIAVETGDTNSAVATAAYTISLTAATPTLSVPAGTYTSAQTVTISDATAGATIHYTTNGTTPTTSSTVYSGPITVSASETLEAIAVETGDTNSAVATAAYTISLTAATPTFSVPAGTYTSAQTVTISDATAGATIHYTTNGTTPTTSSTVYSGPITVSSSETLEAIAAETGYTNSAAAAAVYTINTLQQGGTASDFTISTSNTSASVGLGGSATYVFKVSPVSPSTTFSNNVELSVSGLPTGATYTFNPATVAEGTVGTTVSLTVVVPQTASATKQPTGAGGRFVSRIAPLALGFVLMPFAGMLRRAGKRLSRAMSILLLLAAITAAVLGFEGCVSSIGALNQDFTLNVTGTSGSVSHSAQVTLTLIGQ